MHKCFKCGTQFEGKYCPECGAVWEEEKICPQCGAKLNGGVKFCNQCGYSFVSSESSAKTSTFKQKMSHILAWIKQHIKIVAPVAAGLLVVIVLLSLIPTFILASVNGTYYLYRSGVFIEEDYINLSTGKWTDNDGLSGTYKLSGNKITLVYRDTELGELFGEDATETIVGTIDNKVLTIKEDNVTTRYCLKNHEHKFGETEIFVKPTCIEEGSARKVCDCGFMEISEVPATGIHTVEGGKCLSCNQFQLTYELNEDGNGYLVTGIAEGFDSFDTIEIPAVYNSLPIVAIKDNAFAGNKKLSSITIGKNITSIGNNAFSNLDNLTSVNIGIGVVNIGNYAFANNNNLTSIVMETSVVNIGEGAFANDGKLNDVIIGENVIFLGKDAFSGCSNLASVTFKNTSHWWISSKADSIFGENIDVTNPKTVANYLKKDYSNYYWNQGVLSKAFDDIINKMKQSGKYTYTINENGSTKKYDIDGHVVRLCEGDDVRGTYWAPDGENFYQYQWNRSDSKFHKTNSSEVVVNDIILDKLLNTRIIDYSFDNEEYSAMIDGKEYYIRVKDNEITFFDNEKTAIYTVSNIDQVKLTVPSGKIVIDDTVEK